MADIKMQAAKSRRDDTFPNGNERHASAARLAAARAEYAAIRAQNHPNDFVKEEAENAWNEASRAANGATLLVGAQGKNECGPCRDLAEAHANAAEALLETDPHSWLEVGNIVSKTVSDRLNEQHNIPDEERAELDAKTAETARKADENRNAAAGSWS